MDNRSIKSTARLSRLKTSPFLSLVLFFPFGKLFNFAASSAIFLDCSHVSGVFRLVGMFIRHMQIYRGQIYSKNSCAHVVCHNKTIDGAMKKIVEELKGVGGECQ